MSQDSGVGSSYLKEGCLEVVASGSFHIELGSSKGPPRGSHFRGRKSTPSLPEDRGSVLTLSELVHSYM